MMIRILLVEDNELNRDMLARRLKRRGFDVMTAPDGEEALVMTRQHMPDIPVLALTAHAMIGDRERALESGCDEYETKPVDFQRLLQKIKILLQKSGS